MTRSLTAFAKATVSGLSFSLKDPSLLVSPTTTTSTTIISTAPHGTHNTKRNHIPILFFDVINPANGDVIASVENMRACRTDEAIDRAHLAYQSWRTTTGSHRSKILLQWSELIKEHKDDLAKIMTMESGKPLKESYGEIVYGTSYMDFYAAEALRPTSAGGGMIIPTPFASAADGITARGTAMSIRQGVGVCGIITPWNFPFGMFIRKVAPAFAAGCTTVVKPSEHTPLTAIAIQTLSERAGILPGMFEVITANREESKYVGSEMCNSKIVKKISFTGSTSVGKLLMEQSSKSIKRISLELGGNAAFIVFDDADLDQAVSAAIVSKFRNAGQTCVCADRFIVHETIFDNFVNKFAEEIRKLVVGDGMEKNINVGPLVTSHAVDSVYEKVIEAVEDGAKVIVGGHVMNQRGNFYEPTLLTNVNCNSSIWQKETFGPVAACVSFTTETDAINLANDTTSGLAAYVMTKDCSRIFRLSEQLENGLIGVNEGVISSAFAPFGGIKESGLGREGSSIGIDEYLEHKYIFINH